MKLKIERSNLFIALGHVQNAVERRNTIPILSNVLLVAEENTLLLTATDLDLSVVEKTTAEVSTAGATTTSAHLLYDIVRKLPDGAQIELKKSSDKGRITLTSGRSSFTLPSLPREDFPIMAAQELPHEFALESQELRHLVDKTRFAISTEETRYYLNGIYLHAAESSDTKVLRAVATDGHRLALAECALPAGAANMPEVIVPRKAVLELRRLLEQTESAVEVALSESTIRLSVENTVLTTKLIDGTFPDYQRVIPEANEKFLDVACAEFKSAVDRVSTISTEKSRSVKLSLTNQSLKISATSPDSGSALEELSTSYTGDDIEIGFNSKYLLDITNQIIGDTMRFELSDSVSPAIIRDMGDKRAVYVLMPMRV